MFGMCSSKIYQLYPKRSGHAFVRRMIESWCPESKMIEVENVSPKAFSMEYNDNGVVILQLRSFKNWIASYVKSNKSQRAVIKNVNWWWNVAKEFYSKTNHLKNYKVIKVYYDTFFTDRNYRKAICRELGGSYNEDRINEVGKEGRGSSFDGMEYNGKGQQMNVLERYKGFESIIDQVFKAKPKLKKFCKMHGEI